MVHLTAHAILRCRQQGIDVWNVRVAIAKAPETGAEPTRWRIPGGHLVVYVRSGSQTRVVTVVGRRKMRNKHKRRKRARV